MRNAEPRMYAHLFKRHPLATSDVPGPVLSPGAAVEERKTVPVLVELRGAGGGGHSQGTSLPGGNGVGSHGVGAPDSGLRGSEGFAEGVRSQLSLKSGHNSYAQEAGS